MSKHFEAFLDDLPNSALSKFQKPNGGTIWPNPAGQYNFRFDFQGYTSYGGYNLQTSQQKREKNLRQRNRPSYVGDCDCEQGLQPRTRRAARGLPQLLLHEKDYRFVALCVGCRGRRWWLAHQSPLGHKSHGRIG
ncbi:hypothetical protein BDV06DRAFT_208099 [Aspergillus oleicola]